MQIDQRCSIVINKIGQINRLIVEPTDVNVFLIRREEKGGAKEAASVFM